MRVHGEIAGRFMGRVLDVLRFFFNFVVQYFAFWPFYYKTISFSYEKSVVENGHVAVVVGDVCRLFG